MKRMNLRDLSVKSPSIQTRGVGQGRSLGTILPCFIALLAVTSPFGSGSLAHADDESDSVQVARSQLGDEIDCTKEYSGSGLKVVPEIVGYAEDGKPIYKESGEAN